MAKISRNEACGCGSGLKVKRCCGVARGPSQESLAVGFLRSAAREVAGSAGALSEREFAMLLAELAGDAVIDEVFDELDTPLERARLARAVIAMRDAGRCGRLLAAVALIDLASGSRQLLGASVIQAVAVRAGVARTPAGVLLAA